MINVDVEGEDVQLKVTMSVPFWESRVFTASFRCASRAYAGFLGKAIQDKLFETMQTVRREAYEKGYSDAKAKRAKETWFAGRL